MSAIRPVGSGSGGTAVPFIRHSSTPRGALLIVGEVTEPGDWPTCEADSSESNLSHALGWTCEVRRQDLILLNPLGEGILKTPLPELTVEWLTDIREDGSVAIYLVRPNLDDGAPQKVIRTAAAAGSLAGASVRAAIAADFGANDKVGRNNPCPCGSGKKFKHCHG